MILFIVIAIIILLCTLFADDWLIYHIKKDTKSSKPVRNILGDIGTWFFANVVFNAANAVIVFLVSFCMMLILCFTCPSEKSQWQFNINAMQDNLVTEGNFYGRRGHVDGELSYFYSRTMSLGEKIEHIPANKTYVRYSNDEQPHVEVHQSRIDIPEWMYKVFFLKFMNEKSTDYYVLVVPEGTITNTGQYEIDMR